MGETKELEELRRRYESWPDDELLRVVHAAGDYRSEAVQIARQILAAREVPLEGTAAEGVIASIQSERTAAEDAATLALSPPLRAICFVLCGIPGIAIALYQGSQGHSRRAKDAWAWVGFGWLGRIVLLLVLRFI